MAETLAHRIGIVLNYNGGKAEAGIKRLNKSFGTLKKVLTTVIAGKMVKDMAQFGRELNAMSLRTGASIAKLSSLRNAFISAGSGAQGFERVIGNISSGLRGLSMGRGELAGKLAMFGISPFNANGTLKSEEDVLYSVADWAKSQKGFMAREDILYRMQEILGIDEKLGKQLLNGAEEYRRIRKAADERMGVVESTKNLDELQTKWDEFWGTIKNTGAKAMEEIAVYLNPILDALRELVKICGEYPKITAAVVAVGTIMTAFGGIAGVLGTLGGAATALTGIIIGLKAAIIALILGIVGYGAYRLVKGTVEDIVNKFGGNADKNMKSLSSYIGDRGKVDFQKLVSDFDSGVISKDKDERQYYNALKLLSVYNPKRYGQKLTNESLTDVGRIAMAKYGINHSVPMEHAQASDFLPNAAQAVNQGNTYGGIEYNQNVNVTVEGNATEGIGTEIADEVYVKTESGMVRWAEWSGR